MALHTIHGEAVQYRPRCGRAVHHRDQAKFFVIRAPFLVIGSLAVERSGDLVLKGRVGQQVARQLFDYEPIVGEVVRLKASMTESRYGHTPGRS